MRIVSSIVRWLAVLALGVAVGCGADGGVGGTGISSLSGNVALEEGASAAVTRRSDLEGITVAIQGTDLVTSTDGNGYFEIEGMFEGPVTVEFIERDGTVNMLPVSVPSGSAMALRNVRFSQGQASAERIDVIFEANVTRDAQCDGASGSVEVTDPRSSQRYLVRVDAATVYESRASSCPDGPSCEDLTLQRTLKISGHQSGAIIEAERISLLRCRQPRSVR